MNYITVERQAYRYDVLALQRFWRDVSMTNGFLSRQKDLFIRERRNANALLAGIEHV